MKQYARILHTLICLGGLGVGALGQDLREVVVTVPYNFVAGGKTLPAGTYTVSRLSDSRLGGLSVSSYENRSSVIVIAKDFENHSAESVKVSFNQVGDLHFLSSIETLDGVYTIAAPPRASTMVAGVKQRDGMTAYGSN